MKRINLFLFSSALLLMPITGFSQVQALRTDFTYDGAGNRIKRQVNYGIVTPKPGKGLIDTLVEEIQPEESLTNRSIKVKAYPNPVKDLLVIENLNWLDNSNVLVKLYDMTGKLITSKAYQSSKESLSLKGLASGTYNVYYYLNNELLTQWKIIKY